MKNGLIDNKRLTRLFMYLASIKSPSGDEKEIVEKTKAMLDRLDIKTAVDDTGREYGSNTGNLTAFMKGTAAGQRQPIFLGAHLDTVRIDGDIEPVINDRIIKNKYDYILGGDDKVAAAAIIEALRVIRENNIPVGDIYIIFTISEEIGVVGAKYVDIDSIGAKYGFVFDAHGDVGTIYNQAPYQDSIDAEFKGRAAHAGIEPEKGINAIKAAAAAVSGIETGRIDEGTTCNIGKISGGQARNIVPEKATLAMEARSLDPERLKTVTGNMVEALKKASRDTGTVLDYNLYREYEGFRIESGEPPLEAAVKALKNLGIKPVIASSGGGSDINIFNSRGKRAVNLSAGMEDVHTSSEYVKLEQLQLLARLVLEICTIAIE